MRLAPISRSNLIRRLREFDWTGPHAGGRHQFMVKGPRQLTIPNPHSRADIGINLLKLILDEAGIAREDWLKPR